MAADRLSGFGRRLAAMKTPVKTDRPTDRWTDGQALKRATVPVRPSSGEGLLFWPPRAKRVLLILVPILKIFIRVLILFLQKLARRGVPAGRAAV